MQGSLSDYLKNITKHEYYYFLVCLMLFKHTRKTVHSLYIHPLNHNNVKLLFNET